MRQAAPTEQAAPAERAERAAPVQRRAASVPPPPPRPNALRADEETEIPANATATNTADANTATTNAGAAAANQFSAGWPAIPNGVVSSDRDVTTAVADNANEAATAEAPAEDCRKQICRWSGRRSRRTSARPRRRQANPRPASDTC